MIIVKNKMKVPASYIQILGNSFMGEVIDNMNESGEVPVHLMDE